MSSWFDVIDWNLICDTCGNYLLERATTVEEKKQLEGESCKQPWCTGHYKLINLQDFGNTDGVANTRATRQKAIKEVFFDLPTFDRDAYREECKLQAEADAKQKAARSNSSKPSDRCPKCGQVSFVREISTKRRVGSVFALGLASPTIGKTYRCQSCHHTW